MSKTSSFSINLQSDADSAIPFAIVLTVVIILVSAFALIFGRKHIKKYIGMIHFKDNEFEITAATTVEAANDLVSPVGVVFSCCCLICF